MFRSNHRQMDRIALAYQSIHGFHKLKHTLVLGEKSEEDQIELFGVAFVIAPDWIHGIIQRVEFERLLNCR